MGPDVSVGTDLWIHITYIKTAYLGFVYVGFLNEDAEDIGGLLIGEPYGGGAEAGGMKGVDRPL